MRLYLIYLDLGFALFQNGFPQKIANYADLDAIMHKESKFP
jgi:hypothetical protein